MAAAPQSLGSRGQERLHPGNRPHTRLSGSRCVLSFLCLCLAFSRLCILRSGGQCFAELGVSYVVSGVLWGQLQIGVFPKVIVWNDFFSLTQRYMGCFLRYIIIFHFPKCCFSSGFDRVEERSVLAHGLKGPSASWW